MLYSKRVFKKFKEATERIEYTKPLDGWDREVSICWKRYLKGYDRKELIKGTRFTLYVSPRYYFRKHPSYKYVAKIRKSILRRVKSVVKTPIEKYPWLLGLYYADGSMHSDSQLSFSLSFHEKIIEDRVVKELREIMSDGVHISCDIIGHMRSVRIHSVELCDTLPKKSDKISFLHIWKKITSKEKLEFIAGFIDGDGSCAFEDGIYSIHLYSKIAPYLIPYFKMFLKMYGYCSVKTYSMYLSPTIGKIIKPFTMKQYIRKPYVGSVDVEKAFELLKGGTSVRKVAKMFDKDKKTISIALRRSFDKELIEPLIDSHRTKNHETDSEKNPMALISVNELT